ncbi:MAG: hypothetical protein AAFR21_16680 [Pseudomonadota bacterium]
MKKFILTGCLLVASMSMSGCIAAAIGGVAVAADEIAEGDGKFDPLEEAYDGDDSTTPIIDED